MEDKEVKVSVICTAYNHEPYIRQCLEGFVMQKTDFHFEVIVHDDASTDKTADIIREYEERYPDIIKPIYQRENQYSKGYQYIIDAVSPHIHGKYIAFCEGDDCWINKKKLQMQVNYLDTHPSVMACVGGAVVKDYSRRLSGFFLFPTESGRMVEMGEAIQYGSNFPTATLLIRRELEDIPDIFADLDLNFGDYSVVLWCCLNGGMYSFHRLFSLYRYKTPGSWTQKFDSSVEEEILFRDGLLRLFDAFNKHTDYKYKEFTDKKILSSSVHIGTLPPEYDDLNSELLKKKDSLIGRIKYLARKKAPFFYYLLINMKQVFSRKRDF